MTFKTDNGATYELDYEGKRFRAAEDAQWQPFDHVYVRWGARATIVTPDERVILTSAVTEIS